MRRIKWMGAGTVLAVSLLAGCGEDTQEPVPQPTVSERCNAPTAYLAFDPVNHAPQDLRLQRLDEMLALFDAAAADVSKAPASAASALSMYTATDTNLQAKVKDRKDVHFTTGAEATPGAAMDKSFTGSIEALRTAATAQDVKLAKQQFEKGAVFRFLYLSVMEELMEAPSKKHYDEAYGYLGSGQTNAESGRKGLARLATRRDGNNGTTLAAELFALMLEGGCSLETALAAAGTDTLSLTASQDYASLTSRMDGKLRLVFAYSIGHELVDFAKERANAPSAQVKLFEGEGFLRTLEPYMLAAGGEQAELARDLREAFDAAISASRTDSTGAWTAGLDAEGLLQRLEQVFGIDVKA